MMNNFDPSQLFAEQNKPIDVKELLHRLLKKWYWFAVSVFAFIAIAFLLNSYLSPSYKMISALVIEQSEEGISKANIFKELQAGSESQPQVKNLNPVATLMSYNLNLETLESLDWKTSWYEKTPLYNKDLYPNEPYKISPVPGRTNAVGVPLEFTKLSDTQYLIETDTKLNIGFGTRNIKFSQKGTFGQLFENSYFAFVIESPRAESVNQKDIFFEFNDYQAIILACQKNLKVTTDDLQPGLVSIQFKGSNARRGVDYLNKLQETFIHRGLKEKNKLAENKLRFIDSQLSGATDSLSNSENNFTSFRSRNRVVDIAQEGGLVLQKKEQLENELAVAQIRVDYFQNLQNSMNDPKQMAQVVSPTSLGITDPTLNSLVIKLGDLYTKREVNSFSVKDKAPSQQVLLKEIKLTQTNLSEVANNLLANAQLELQNLRTRQGGVSSQLSALPQTEQQLVNLKRKFEMNTELYNFLVKLRTESAITYASNLPDAKVLDPARLETTKLSSPKTAINYLVAMILGLLIPFGVIKISDYLNDSIQTKEEVEKLTKVPVAGVISHNKYNNELTIVEHPRSGIAESFRLLRTNLKYLLSRDEEKIIAIQSTLAGEGKSFTALNLAAIIAMNNLKVLLVGVDMRMSKLHLTFNSDNKTGISTYLSNQSTFEEVVRSTSLENLSFVSSGPVPPNPAELLENGAFERFLAKAKTKFDYIILDTPPVSMVADG
ncbi:MAG: polysaccharide biosynthesis tyrosine autokinase, partial [Bacteroidia bacterium]|nr:polysaccharide biosynthesis tyrosine autokinase [Bacteroidia bacterium]